MQYVSIFFVRHTGLQLYITLCKIRHTAYKIRHARISVKHGLSSSGKKRFYRQTVNLGIKTWSYMHWSTKCASKRVWIRWLWHYIHFQSLCTPSSWSETFSRHTFYLDIKSLFLRLISLLEKYLEKNVYKNEYKNFCFQPFLVFKC